MLTTLRIKNLALVHDLTLDFQPGYNAITGETGAGKSILIGALSLLLGERADRSLIRSESDSCSVEGVFDTARLRAPLAAFLAQNGLEPCEDNLLVLKRSFTAAGTNRQFVNGSPTTLAVLAEVGEFLVDIHGPHEHQSLLRSASQLAILDAFGRLEPDREAYAALLARRSLLQKQKAGLVVDEKTYARELDLLRFQANEISAANLDPAEEERIEADYRRASNGARLLQLGQTALDLVGENESAVLTQAGAVGRTLQELQRIDNTVAFIVALHEQGVAAFRELQSALSHYLDRMEVDPARLQEIEERLNVLHSLKRKYGSTVAEVIAYGEQIRARLRNLEARDVELERINAELVKVERELWAAGLALSAKRRKLRAPLAKSVCKQLADLGFKQSRFDVEMKSLDPVEAGQLPESSGEPCAGFTQSGIDSVEFLFAPNPGEPEKPLRAIASSGELARLMLALKTVLAAEDRVPVLVFDEVDANVGGETARTVGEKMAQIAQKRQVLCITHLPQVAAPASTHFLVRKTIKDGRTITGIDLLDKKARVTELARMLGGQSQEARRHAEALLNAQC